MYRLRDRWSLEEAFKLIKARLQFENWSGILPHTVTQDFYAPLLRANCAVVLAWAARVNGYVGDIHEMNDLTCGHASIGTVPAVLTLADTLGCSGRQVMEAVVTGIEVTSRVYSMFYPTMKAYTDVGIVCVEPDGAPRRLSSAMGEHASPCCSAAFRQQRASTGHCTRRTASPVRLGFWRARWVTCRQQRIRLIRPRWSVSKRGFSRIPDASSTRAAGTFTRQWTRSSHSGALASSAPTLIASKCGFRPTSSRQYRRGGRHARRTKRGFTWLTASPWGRSVKT